MAAPVAPLADAPRSHRPLRRASARTLLLLLASSAASAIPPPLASALSAPAGAAAAARPPSTDALRSASGLPVCRYALGGAARSVQPATLPSLYRDLALGRDEGGRGRGEGGRGRGGGETAPAPSPACAPFLFYYTPHRYPAFLSGVRALCEGGEGGDDDANVRREDLFVASGGTDRSDGGMDRRLRDALERGGGRYLDMFVLEYVLPSEMEGGDGSGDGERISLRPGSDLSSALRRARSWVDDGTVRYVCASTHSHAVGAGLAADPNLDALMLRYGMTHREAAERLSLPAARGAGKPVLAFTTTRWNALQGGHPDWAGGPPPSSSECLSWALASDDAVEVVLHSARDEEELREAMGGLRERMGAEELERWRAFGDLSWNDRDEFDEYPEERFG